MHDGRFRVKPRSPGLRLSFRTAYTYIFETVWGERMQWRLGVDLGTNSLGWCVVELDDNGRPFRIVALGTRIFSDGRDRKSKPLAVKRREARAQRRRRDRFLERQDGLLDHLAEFGLFPPEADRAARAALQELDPFALRARALDEALTLHEIGRALFHLNQRRGFKSNRKADRGSDDAGKIRIGVKRLLEAMEAEGARSFGAFLHKRRAGAPDENHIPSVRTRLRPEPGDNAKGSGYDFYPDRALLEAEFDAIIDAQRAHHPAVLTDAVRKALFDIIFHQRPLKPAKVGRCTLLFATKEERLPTAHPLFQRRRLLEEVNALKIVRVGENPLSLTLEQRDLLELKLKGAKSVPFETLRLKVLKLDPDSCFNKESKNRKEMKGDEIASLMGHKTRFGARWALLSFEAQWEIIRRLREAESDADTAALREWLHAEHRLTPEQQDAVLKAHLPDGYGRLGETATKRLIAALEADVIVYSEAVERAGLGHHSDFRSGAVYEELPYYGEVLERHVLPGSGNPNDPDEARYGKLTNPTVHIGLNQLRRVVNRLIGTYGPPAEIALELARELKLSEEEKARRNQDNKRNREDAERRSAMLGEMNVADKNANRILKLWEELNLDNCLDRRCIYTGERISANMLFSGSVEIDHILPFSATLDDSMANRLLCVREANRIKRNRSPFEAFGHSAAWDQIAARASRLPRSKRWRFEPDAMTRFDKDGGFLARQLVDTQYLSRRAREYVSALYPDRGEGSSHVWVSPGRLTEMLRHGWGLNRILHDDNAGGSSENPKNRLDHRHHAIDAAVIAVTDRALLQRIAHESGRRGAEEARRITADLPTPWDGFREELESAIALVVTSHRPDHGRRKSTAAKDRGTTSGQLHDATAYGYTGKTENGVDLVVHRIPFDELTPNDLIDGKRRVADPYLREELLKATAGTEGKSFLQALMAFKTSHPRFQNIRHVRVLEPLSLIPIRDRNGRVYKGYKPGSNERYDVWELTNGRWVSEVVSTFDAHQPGLESRVRREHHNPRKVLALHRDDVLAVERGGSRELMCVVKISERQIALAPPNEAGALKTRDADKSDPFRYVYPSPNTLKAWGARQVRIDELGRVWDPGPRTRTEPG